MTLTQAALPSRSALTTVLMVLAGSALLGLSAQAVRQRLLDWRRTIDRAFGGALMGLGVWLAAARAGT